MNKYDKKEVFTIEVDHKGEKVQVTLRVGEIDGQNDRDVHHSRNLPMMLARDFASGSALQYEIRDTAGCTRHLSFCGAHFVDWHQHTGKEDVATIQVKRKEFYEYLARNLLELDDRSAGRWSKLIDDETKVRSFGWWHLYFVDRRKEGTLLKSVTSLDLTYIKDNSSET